MKKQRGDRETRGHGGQPSPRVAVSRRSRVSTITLLTDFGNADYFVGAVKGVILGINPKAIMVDITHEIPPHDIEAGAFTLLAACPSFPRGTIHVAVVDPGVGSSRRAILVKTQEGFFVGPDNGIFSYVCEHSENLGQTPELFHLTNTKYFRRPVSETFHGRDVFSPVAAALSLHAKPNELGKVIPEIVRLPPLRTTTSRDGRLMGRIIHIDRFGNCVTNITQRELTAKMIAAGATLAVNRKTVKSFRNYFGEAAIDHDKVFGIWGSAGFLEIAAANESAAKLLKVRRGDAVTVTTQK